MIAYMPKGGMYAPPARLFLRTAPNGRGPTKQSATGGAYVTTLFVGMYATQGRYKCSGVQAKTFLGLHSSTLSDHQHVSSRALVRLRAFRKHWAASLGESRHRRGPVGGCISGMTVRCGALTKGAGWHIRPVFQRLRLYQGPRAYKTGGLAQTGAG
jgi:hypothetical protein